jgi:hypothetical protein
MSDKRDSKDKIVVLWSNPYDNQNGTDMYKSLSIDASVTSKTIKNILEGKSNFKIDTFQDIASSAGMRYFMLPFVQTPTLTRLVTKYCYEKEYCWFAVEENIPEIVAHLIQDSASVDYACSTVAAQKYKALAVLGVAQAKGVSTDFLNDVWKEVTDKMLVKIIEIDNRE